MSRFMVEKQLGVVWTVEHWTHLLKVSIVAILVCDPDPRILTTPLHHHLFQMKFCGVGNPTLEGPHLFLPICELHLHRWRFFFLVFQTAPPLALRGWVEMELKE